MSKHIEKVPALGEFNAPWESDAGEVEIDKPKLKKWIHNLLSDKAKAQDSRDEEAEKVKTIEAERDELKGQIDSKDPDSAGKIAKLETKLKDAEAQAAKADLRADRAEIAAEKGLTPKQAKRLTGDTREELEADADELLEDLGITPGADDDDDDDDDERTAGRTTPRVKRTLVNGGDAKNGADTEPDYEAAAALIQGNSPF